MCEHMWSIIEEIKVFDTSFGVKSERPSNKIYIIQCKKCGKLIKKEI